MTCPFCTPNPWPNGINPRVLDPKDPLYNGAYTWRPKGGADTSSPAYHHAEASRLKELAARVALEAAMADVRVIQRKLRGTWWGRLILRLINM